MDLLSKRELEGLTRNTEGPCGSVFLPTHRAGTETRQDPIRLKNLLGEVRERLVATKRLRTTEADGLLEPARELLKDEPFWRHQADGLALFLSPGAFRSYRLPLSFEALAVVADRFHLEPSYPSSPGTGVSTSSPSARTRSGCSERRATARTSSSSGTTARASPTPSSSTTLRSSCSSTPARAEGEGGRAAVFHGHGAEDDPKDDILRYFRKIDRGLKEVLRGSEAPLVVAGVDYLLPIYREANTYPGLLEEGVEGSPEGLSPGELHRRAWEVVGPLFLAAREGSAGRYAALAGTGQTSSDVREVVRAAYFGRAETLFAALGVRRWGVFDAGTAEVHLHDEPEAGDGDLLDFAAVQTLLNGGTVYAVEPGKMPDGADAACVFRY